MNWYIGCWKKYATFEGRARRTEYWMFVLFNAIAAFITGFMDGLLGVSFFTPIYALAVFIPGLAVTVRRLHDTNHSGWWFLITFVPCIGQIWLLILLVCNSTLGSNRFGPNPKATV